MGFREKGLGWLVISEIVKRGEKSEALELGFFLKEECRGLCFLVWKVV